MKKKSLLITLLIYILCIGIGCVLGFTIDVIRWPDCSVPILSITISYFVALILSTTYLSIVHKEDVVVDTLFKGAIAIGIVIKFTYTKIFWPIFDKTWNFLWVLSIVVWFPVLGLGITALMFIIPFIAAVTLIVSIGLGFALPFVIAFDETFDTSSVKNVLPLVIGMFLSIGITILNVLNFTNFIPDYQNAKYSINYVLPDGAKLVNPNNGEDKFYYQGNLGKKEEHLCSATKNGYTFEGWYYDEACTIEFESFGNYQKAEDITLYPKFVESMAEIEYSFYSFDFSGKSTRINKNDSSYNKFVDFNVSCELDKIDITGYIFMGWSLEHVNGSDFTSGNFQFVDSFVPTVDQATLDNKISVYGVYIEKPTSKMPINTQFTVGNYKKGSSSYKNVNCGYYVSGSEKTEYSLIINHGSSYDRYTYENDYIIAHIYDENLKYITSLNSSNGGGNFTVDSHTDFYIYFTSLDNSGKINQSAEYEQALAMLIDQNVNVFSMIGALNTNNLSTINYNSMNANSGLAISDNITSYSLLNKKIVFKEEDKELGFTINDIFDSNTNVYGSISIFKNGEFITSGYAELTGLAKNTYVKILDISDYKDSQYEFRFSLSNEGEKSIYNKSIYMTIK